MKIVSLQRDIIRSSMVVLLIGSFALTASADGRGNQIRVDDLVIDAVISVGIAPGQTARVTMNVLTSFIDASGVGDSGNANLPVMVRIQLLDMEGEVIAQSDEISVPPGQIRFWDVPRESLPAAGERGTGRLQVQARILVQKGSFDRNRTPLLSTLELIDNSTGKTEVLEGQQCLVFFLGGIPN